MIINIENQFFRTNTRIRSVALYESKIWTTYWKPREKKYAGAWHGEKNDKESNSVSSKFIIICPA